MVARSRSASSKNRAPPEKRFTDRYNRQGLLGYIVRGERVTGAKEVRARPAAAAAENGLISVVRGRHSNDFLDELTAFPHGAHDDCVDALAGAYDYLSTRGGTLTVHRPRGRIPVDTGITRLPGRVYGSNSITEVVAYLGARIYPSRPA